MKLVRFKEILNIIKMKRMSPNERAKALKKSGIKIGENCEIYDNVNLGSEPYLIQIGDNVRITRGVTFLTHDGGIWVLRNKELLKNGDIFGQIKIGNNVHIGINSIIMPNVTIGDNVIVGVGAVVTKDIPSNAIAVGVPAKVIKSIDEYYDKCKNHVDFTKNMNYEEKRKYLIKKYNINKI